MAKTNNISNIEGAIELLLPDGSKKFFRTSKEAQLFYLENYSDKAMEIIHNKEDSTPYEGNTPTIKVGNRTVIATDLNIKQSHKVANADELVQNTSFQHGPFDLVSASTGGVSRVVTEPTYLLGTLSLILLGNPPSWQLFMFGDNRGIFESPSLLEFYSKYPRLSNAINIGIDFITPYTTAKIYKWGTTPKLIGKGAEAEVYSAPFWGHVKKYGLDPEYVELKNSVPGVVPTKFKGYTSDGISIYTQPKVLPIKGTGRLLRNYYLKLVDKHFFPVGNLERIQDFINPVTRMAITDLDGNLGLTWKGIKSYDPAVLTLDEYTSIMKKGGIILKRRNIFLNRLFY